MSRNPICRVVLLYALWPLTVFAEEVGTSFTAQAVLSDGGVPVNNTVDIQATLFDEAVDGLIVAGPIQIEAVNVVNGILTWEMDFGGDVFNGEARFIELAIRNPGDPADTEPFTTLDQRIRITPAPEAINAQQATAIDVPATLSQDDAGFATLTVENTAGVGSTALDVKGDADVTGNVSTGPIIVLGEANVLGNLEAVDVNAANNLGAGANLNIAGDGSVNGQMSVTGNTTLSADLGVTGDTTLSGLLDATGDTTLSSDLAVTGDTTLSGLLDVTGDATLSSDLDVTNDMTLGNDLSVGNDITLAANTITLRGASGDAHFNGTVGFGPDPANPLVRANAASIFVGDPNGLSFSASSLDGTIAVGPGSNLSFNVDGTTGDTFIGGELELDEAFIDGVNDSPGAADQFLSSTGTATEWRDLIVGDLDMKTHALINIGTGGTSFGGDGGLNLKGPLDMGGQGITSIGSNGSEFFADGSLAVHSTFAVGSGDTPVFGVDLLSGITVVFGDLEVVGAYFDSTGSPGLGNQVLSSTETGTEWINPPGSGGDGIFDTLSVALNALVGGTLEVLGSATVLGDFTVFGAGESFGGRGGGMALQVGASFTHSFNDVSIGVDIADPRFTLNATSGDMTVKGSSTLGDAAQETTTQVNGNLYVSDGSSIIFGVDMLVPNMFANLDAFFSKEVTVQDFLTVQSSTSVDNVIVDGETGFIQTQGNLSVLGNYIDSAGSAGNDGQILSSTGIGNGTEWIDLATPSPEGDFLIGGNLGVNGTSTLGTGAENQTTVIAKLTVVDPTNPATDITLDGTSGDIHVPGRYHDSGDLAGTAGQVLSSTGTGTEWKDCDCSGGGGGNSTVTNLTVQDNTTLGDDGTVDVVTVNAKVTFDASPGTESIVVVPQNQTLHFKKFDGLGYTDTLVMDEDGTLRFEKTVDVQSTLKDSTGSVGTDGQVLSSTVTGVTWIDLPPGTGGDATFDNLTVNNTATVQGKLTTSTIAATEKISTTKSLESGIGSTNFFGPTLVAGSIDISGFSNATAFEVFAVNSLGAGTSISNFGTGVALDVNGTLTADVITAPVKNFQIDHPLDPANSYLVHASVESSEMVNVYSGNVVTDGQGKATVFLPDWFEALNTDFRYQLTVIGSFSRAMIAGEIRDGAFTIATEDPHTKVSWQVTGVRQDAYALAHPMVVEQPKPNYERGLYRHPEIYGLGPELSIHSESIARGFAHQAEIEDRMEEQKSSEYAK